MKKVQISEIPELIKKYDRGLRLMDASDNKLDVETSDYWMRDSEKEYNKVINALDSISAKGKGYFIYVWYDVSGFDYWSKDDDSNYAQITIQFDQDTINASQLPALERKINKVIDKVNNVINF